MSIESIMLDEIRVVAKEHDKRLPPLTKDLPLLESGLDSLCFAILMSRLEDLTGHDPFVSISGSSYPRTLGDLIALYDKAHAYLQRAVGQWRPLVLQAHAALGFLGARAARPDASGALRSSLGERCVNADTSMMGRFFRRLGVTFKRKTATFLDALRDEGLEAPCLFDGPINGERFRDYSCATGGRAAGARLVFLPKYLFDFSLIEQVFAKFKTLLRKAGARTYDAVVNASVAILAQYPREE